jgi:hypothetical protein
LLQKALYGCLQSELFFYKKLVRDLKSKWFKLNRYNLCVANKIVQGKQFTIIWHIDDLKMPHMEYDEVTSMIGWLKKIYGGMKSSRGKKHDYLDTTLDFE